MTDLYDAGGRFADALAPIGRILSAPFRFLDGMMTERCEWPECHNRKNDPFRFCYRHGGNYHGGYYDGDGEKIKAPRHHG